MLIDLRSDTVTKPTEKMKDVMFSAEVGDDVFGEDPTIDALEKKAAKLFGMESALFCPSGTMTNQIAIRVHTKPGDEVICSSYAHIYNYEGGGIASNSGCSTKLLSGNRGRFTLDQVKQAVNPDDIHMPSTQLVSIENTSNKGGGALWDTNDIEEIGAFCRTQNLRFHLDGARLFNAIVAGEKKAVFFGHQFDSISICLSKGLGAPVGSILLGKDAFIHQARRIRKSFGGGMRQAGILAAAGIYALDHHVNRLSEDHKRAKILADEWKTKEYVKEIFPVESNIVIARTHKEINIQSILNSWKSKGLLAVPMGSDLIRLVTHLDFTDQQLNKAVDILKKTT